MILSKESIRRLVGMAEKSSLMPAERKLIIRPLREEALNPASIDLTLGPKILRVRQSAIDEDLIVEPRVTNPSLYWEEFDISGPDGYVLEPGETILASTAEVVSIPTHLVAELADKSSMARVFLSTHANAGFGDPGWGVPDTTEWTLELKNTFMLKIRIRAGMPVVQMKLTLLNEPTNEPYAGAYQSQRGPVASRPVRGGVMQDTEVVVEVEALPEAP